MLPLCTCTRIRGLGFSLLTGSSVGATTPFPVGSASSVLCAPPLRNVIDFHMSEMFTGVIERGRPGLRPRTVQAPNHRTPAGGRQAESAAEVSAVCGSALSQNTAGHNLVERLGDLVSAFSAAGRSPPQPAPAGETSKNAGKKRATDSSPDVSPVASAAAKRALRAAK